MTLSYIIIITVYLEYARYLTWEHILAIVQKIVNAQRFGETDWIPNEMTEIAVIKNITFFRPRISYNMFNFAITKLAG